MQLPVTVPLLPRAKLSAHNADTANGSDSTKKKWVPFAFSVTITEAATTTPKREKLSKALLSSIFRKITFH